MRCRVLLESDERVYRLVACDVRRARVSRTAQERRRQNAEGRNKKHTQMSPRLHGGRVSHFCLLRSAFCVPGRCATIAQLAMVYDHPCMAKNRQQETQSSSGATLALLAVGGLLVAGLVVWALTRTVETHAPVATTETSAPIAAPVTSGTNGFVSNTTTSPLPVSVAPPPSEDSKASVPRIAVEDLREKMKAGQVTVIDVRPAESYQAAHIEGAINIHVLYVTRRRIERRCGAHPQAQRLSKRRGTLWRIRLLAPPRVSRRHRPEVDVRAPEFHFPQ
jgi:hypothetical protein